MDRKGRKPVRLEAFGPGKDDIAGDLQMKCQDLLTDEFQEHLEDIKPFAGQIKKKSGGTSLNNTKQLGILPRYI